jgi:regulation of enolase protein 1 (concanavalin A-like superfamily)
VGSEDAVRYDPTGLMPWIDEKNGLQFGIEFVRGIQRPRAVVIRAGFFRDGQAVPQGRLAYFTDGDGAGPG